MNLQSIQEKIPKNKTTLGLIAAVVLLLLGGVFLVQRIVSSRNSNQPLQEVNLPFDAAGPYAILTPRRDGKALVLNITRVSSYDAISYVLAYQSQGIDRGVEGTIDTKDKKSEYNQEILFGTCSQGFTSGSHCVFDPEVENGTLTLRIQKGNIVYVMNTSWHLQQPDIALGQITSGDQHFSYTTDAPREELANVAWTIVNDLSGVPKLPDGKDVLGKVYAFNVPAGINFAQGQIRVEQAETPPAGATLARYDYAKSAWENLDTKPDASMSGVLTSTASSNGIFAVLVNQAAATK
jgi:hypothetical protein